MSGLIKSGFGFAFGFPKKNGVPVIVAPTPAPTTPPTLISLALSAYNVTENTAPGTIIGAILNSTALSTVTLSDNAGGRVAISGANLVTGSSPINYEAGSTFPFTFLESLTGATNSPKSTTLTINVSNVFEQPNLGTLSLSQTTFTVGSPTSGAINGATSGSTIVATGLPTGLTINGPARTWAWDGTGSAASGSFTLTETLADSANSPVPTTIGYTVSAAGGGGTGTLAAPTLSYPSPLASNPYTIAMSIPVDWQTGDVLKLAYASDAAFTSPTVLTHTITDADITAGTIAISIPTGTSIRYHRAYGAHAGLDSAHISNIVAWGDTTAPTITTSATQSVTETLPLAIALAATDAGGVASWTIDSGPDQLQYEISGSTLRWASNGSKVFSTDLAQDGGHVFHVTVGAIDYSGNLSTLAISVTLTAADLTPNAFSWTNQSSASLSTVYTAANTWTVAGLDAGINAPLSVTGGLISKNGGAFSSTSTTVQNGDTIQARGTSSGSYSSNTNVAVTVGTVTATFTIATGLDPARAAFVASSVQPDWQNTGTVYTFGPVDFVGGLGVVYTAPGGGAATGVKIKAAGVAGADISLVKRVDHTSGFDQHIWVCPDAQPIISTGNYNVEVTMGSANQDMAVLCGTLLNASTGVPTSVARLNAYVSTSTPTATSALTISATGVGAAFCYGNGNVTATNGTHLTQGIGNWGGGGTSVKNGAISRNSTTGSWTPAFSTAGGGGAAMLCATWDH